MDINFASVNAKDFDPHIYLQLLVSVAKADRFNGPPEIEFVKRQADRLPVDFEIIWNSTDKSFQIDTVSIVSAGNVMYG